MIHFSERCASWVAVAGERRVLLLASWGVRTPGAAD
jgi:hypothetical protein